LSALASTLLPHEAVAQTASQITPPSFRPAPTGGGASVEFFGSPGLESPPGAEKLSITLRRVQVEGTLPALEAETREITARIAGRRILASAIFEAARELEAAYSRAGYILVRVILPAQTLRDGGDLRLTIVNGFIEAVDAARVPDRIRDRVIAIVSPLVGQPGLTRAEIERRLLLAGDTPGVSLRSTLTSGQTPGAAILIVDAQYRLRSSYVGFDNTLAAELGHTSIGLGLDLNSALGFGELFYFRGSGHPGGNGEGGLGGLLTDNPRMRSLAAGVVIPLGTDGLNLNIEGTDSQTTPKPTAGIQTNSVFDRLSIRLRYPWIRSRDLNFSTELAFDAQNEGQDLLTQGAELPLSKDRLRIFRLSGDLNWENQWSGVFTGRAIASFGINGLGARGVEDASDLIPLSTAGADAEFQKLEVILSYSQPVADHLAFALYARGQTSFNQPLAQSEQIGFASFGEMSTFDAGTLGGDSGWMVRAEVSSPWLVTTAPVPIVAIPYAYAAMGMLYLAEPTVLEQERTQVGAVAGGVRIASVFDPGFSEASLALEYGRSFRDDGEPDENRFTVVGSVRF
jgi:hemolysin activation/secretion protein